MTEDRYPLTNRLYTMTPVEINQAACIKLDTLLRRCTINLVADLTGISRPTLYRWLDADLSLEEMNHHGAAWFIMMCETSPRIRMLLDRPPLSRPRLARRVIEEAEEGVEENDNE